MPKKSRKSAWLTLWLTLAAPVALAPTAAQAATHDAKRFASPDAAVAALDTAVTAHDSAALLAIFGPDGGKLVFSGDQVADADMQSRFSANLAAGHSIMRDGTSRAFLVLGKDNWPFPIPLQRRGRFWRFDTDAGAQEILNRRIGRDELRAIKICHGFVEAQHDYTANQRVPVYAQRIISQPGQHDGLYWPASATEKPSPLGPQVAAAEALGYSTAGADSGREPYHGYIFHILTAQGPNAPGGATTYIAGGKMTGGFALIGFPAKYGDSGVMTFIVNQNGIVYQKDLGPKTQERALAISSFDPDSSWAPQ